MGATGEHDFAGLDAAARRLVWIVVAIHAGTALLLLATGRLADSQAMQADALDFLAFGASYGVSLWAVGQPKERRLGAGLVKAAALFVFGIWIAVTTLYQFFTRDVPEAEIMALVGLVALGANGLTLYLLEAQRAGDKRLGAIWLAARNDMIGTGAVMVAAGLVALLNASTPDLVVAGVMVVLFLTGAYQALRQSFAEWQAGREP